MKGIGPDFVLLGAVLRVKGTLSIAQKYNKVVLKPLKMKGSLCFLEFSSDVSIWSDF